MEKLCFVAAGPETASHDIPSRAMGKKFELIDLKKKKSGKLVLLGGANYTTAPVI